jgi:hypothetical protein
MPNAAPFRIPFHRVWSNSFAYLNTRDTKKCFMILPWCTVSTDSLTVFAHICSHWVKEQFAMNWILLQRFDLLSRMLLILSLFHQPWSIAVYESLTDWTIIHTLPNMNVLPKTKGIIHSMIKANCQLIRKDDIKLPMTENNLTFINTKSIPIPFWIVSMLLEKSWIRCSCLT